jgi:hypothetical protein
MNQTLMEISRSMINNANLKKELLAEAVSIACYLVNKSTSVAIKCKIPEEVWTDQCCDYSHLRIFGCDAYSLIPKNQRSKLDPKSKLKGHPVKVLPRKSCVFICVFGFSF